MAGQSETKRFRTSTGVHDVDHLKYEQVFTDYYTRLSSALPTSEMLPSLLTIGVITMHQKEQIQAKETSLLRTSTLLDGPIWTGIINGCPDGFIKLLYVMPRFNHPTCDVLAKKILSDLDISSDVMHSYISCMTQYQSGSALTTKPNEVLCNSTLNLENLLNTIGLIQAHWYIIGTRLNLSPEVLQVFLKEAEEKNIFPKEPYCCCKMLQCWYETADCLTAEQFLAAVNFSPLGIREKLPVIKSMLLNKHFDKSLVIKAPPDEIEKQFALMIVNVIKIMKKSDTDLETFKQALDHCISKDTNKSIVDPELYQNVSNFSDLLKVLEDNGYITHTELSWLKFLLCDVADSSEAKAAIEKYERMIIVHKINWCNGPKNDQTLLASRLNKDPAMINGNDLSRAKAATVMVVGLEETEVLLDSGGSGSVILYWKIRSEVLVELPDRVTSDMKHLCEVAGITHIGTVINGKSSMKELKWWKLYVTQAPRQVNQTMINLMLEARRKGKTMKVRFGKVVFSGCAGAGKTSFVELLLSKRFQPKPIRTDLHESERVSAFKIGMQQSSHCMAVKFAVLDIEKEISELASHLTLLAKHSQLSDNEQSKVENSSTELRIDGINQNDSTNLSVIELKMVEKGSLTKDKSPCYAPCSEDNDIWNIITFLDTGGQPEFISMLPAVNSFAMVTFIVHNMADKLDNPVTVTHGKKDNTKSFAPHTLSCTNLQLIRSLVSFTNNYLFGRPVDEIFDIKDERKSYLSFIGTHLDKISDNAISTIDKELSKIVSDSQLTHVWKQVQGDYEYLIPVNNITAGTVDEDKNADRIRCKVYDALCEQTIYHVPIVWLLLELEIHQICERRNDHAIFYDEVVEMCREKKLLDKEEDIKNGLRFHHLFGTLLYFEEVKGMSEIVFTDLQWLFDKLADIVKLSYGESDVVASEEFEHKGIFKITLLNKLDFTFKHLGSINTQKIAFLRLLEHLRIIAPIKQPHGISDKYFMPCLLNNYCNFDPRIGKHNFLEDYGKQLIYGSTPVTPLLIQLALYSESNQKINAFPRGMFCGLVVELLQDKSKWDLVWSVTREEVFDNLVTLSYEATGHIATLIDRVMFLEVEIRHENTCEPPVHYEIKDALTSSLLVVCDTFNVDKFTVMFGFLCNKCQGGETHMTYLSGVNKCLCRFGKRTLLEDSHKVWLEKCSTSTSGRQLISEDQNRPTLQQLNDHVRPQAAPQWNDLGVKLLSDDKIDAIKINNHGNVEACCTDMFKTWLKKDTEASWTKLVDALRAPSVGLYILADEIKQRFAVVMN